MSLHVPNNKIKAIYAIYNDKFVNLRNLWRASIIENIPVSFD